jgi:modulator of FtsH protease HflK
MRQAERTFRAMTEAVVRRVVGDSSVDEILTVGRARMALEAKVELQRLCDDYEIGIDVNQLIFQDVNPPDPVKPSFNEVNESLQEKERKINEAWSEYNNVVPRASGEAEQMIRGAEGYLPPSASTTPGATRRGSSPSTGNTPRPPWSRASAFIWRPSTRSWRTSTGRSSSTRARKNVLPLLNLGEEVKK